MFKITLAKLNESRANKTFSMIGGTTDTLDIEIGDDNVYGIEDFEDDAAKLLLEIFAEWEAEKDEYDYDTARDRAAEEYFDMMREMQYER